MEFQAINSIISKLEAGILHGIPTVKVHLPEKQILTALNVLNVKSQEKFKFSYFRNIYNQAWVKV